MSYFYFIRHAPTANNIKKIRCGGDIDIPLIENFEPYLKEALVRIKEISINKIHTSPLLRTTHTAKFIAQQLSKNTTITIDDRLTERSLGKLNFLDIQATQEIIRNPPISYDVEDNKIFQDRVIDYVNELRKIEPYNLNKTLVVSSKGIARILTETLKFEVLNGETDVYANCQLIKIFLK